MNVPAIAVTSSLIYRILCVMCTITKVGNTTKLLCNTVVTSVPLKIVVPQLQTVVGF